MKIGIEAFTLPESVPNKPIIIGSWQGFVLLYFHNLPIFLGSNPSLPSILLNSHYDVVPIVIEVCLNFLLFKPYQYNIMRIGP